MTNPDQYTSEARLCDDAGIVSDQQVTPANQTSPELTYRQRLNNLRAHTALPPYNGAPIRCTGSAHLAGEHIRCTSPAHTATWRPARLGSPSRAQDGPYESGDAPTGDGFLVPGLMAQLVGSGAVSRAELEERLATAVQAGTDAADEMRRLDEEFERYRADSRRRIGKLVQQRDRARVERDQQPGTAPAYPTNVLAEIADERSQQDAKWGEQNHPDGTEEQCRNFADDVRTQVQRNAKNGTLTWLDILTEEYAEASAETDPQRLRAELVQVAAVAVAWVEAIDRRATVDQPGGE